ncbi:serine hydrolase domain-containing protein [Amphibacillus jilinensis]|uniref:serine hydrolase domain-containing protein n=1 Tax=Amphibacillus jilinensis TaxID=1216008 RepID=UPI0002E1ACF0|nr:serine hydrolase domain-containing protein [Amphibacillus jilinensis]
MENTINTALRLKLNSHINSIKELNWFNGVILVAHEGEILLCESMGLAEIKDTRWLTTSSIFDLASVSKPITALGIIRLYQLGKLDWSDMVSKWLPELPYPSINIRHLLTHTSGLPDYMELIANVWNPEHIATNKDVLDALEQYKPDPYFAPNEKWMYSNTGYVILAILIERISGQPFGEFLKDQIFQPLGMKHTKVYNRRVNLKEIPNDYAWGYVYDTDSNSFVLPDELPDLNFVKFLDGIQGDGMVHSTVYDLLRLDQSLYDDSFIEAELRHEMFKPTKLNNGEIEDYGFGWLLEKNDQLGNIVCHGGGWPGYTTTYNRYLDNKFTLIMLQNVQIDFEYTNRLQTEIEEIIVEVLSNN